MAKTKHKKDYTWEFLGFIAAGGFTLWLFSQQAPTTAAGTAETDVTQGVSVKIDTDLATDLAVGALGGHPIHAAMLKPIIRGLAGRIVQGHNKVKIGTLS